jgi:ubiquitin C-terminal hydrolase
MDLSVEIPRKAVRYLGSINISECLQKFIESESLCNTGFKCSSCKKKVDIEKDLTIYRFP